MAVGRAGVGPAQAATAHAATAHAATAQAATGQTATGQAAVRAGRLPKIGYLILQPLAHAPSRERQAFLDGLRELGYVPGRSVELVYASAEGEAAFLPDVCAELIRKKVDVIVTAGAQAAVAAQAATQSVPIVFAVGDPVGIGRVKSLARPGGNITGVSFLSTDLAGKRLQMLKEMLPRAKRIALLWNPKNTNTQKEREAALAAARILGLAAQEFSVATDAEPTAPATPMAAVKVSRVSPTYGATSRLTSKVLTGRSE